MKPLLLPLVMALGLAAVAAQAPQQQPNDIATTINGASGAPPRLALPTFIPLTTDAETVAAAKTITDVLWDDLNYEHEFAFIARDVNATIPVARSLDDVPLDRWREVNADGVIVGTVQKSGTSFQVRFRLYNVTTKRSVFAKEYGGSPNIRQYAHTIADEIFSSQRSLKGVARTKIAFDSDRDGERLGGTIEARNVKEIYIADYDGENQRRVTTGRTLNINAAWSPDGRSIAYSSYRRGPGNIFVSHIYEGTLDEITKGQGESWLPAWSPDGTRIAFTSTRDAAGNSEIYVANRDGTNVRRLTNNPALDSTPTWSPTGTEIAFQSDRSGSPQIYVMSADGLGGVQRLTAESYADRPTWSSSANEIAFESRTSSTSFDIKIINMNDRTIRQLTFGEGSNESPAFSPNGRHIAFASNRSGKWQIYTMTRDGRDVRAITKVGNNFQPNWSN